MRYPLDELLDKRSIVQLKKERSGEHEALPKLTLEFNTYTEAISEYVNAGVCTQNQVEDWHKRLYEANGNTWDLETKIRKGQIGDLTLEEIGRTAIAIRESNGVRVRIKSEIVEKTGIGFKDIKVNHASEKTLYGNN